MSLALFKHLLPRSAAWSLINPAKRIRQFFDGLAAALVTASRVYIDAIWLDMFPATTRHIDAWEELFGLTEDGLSLVTRRARLAGKWSATGGQTYSYIDEQKYLSGVNVSIYQWWSDSVPTVRNPLTILGGQSYGAGDPTMEAGEGGYDYAPAEAGESWPGAGYMLVNKLYTAEMDLTVLAGEPTAEAGEPTAEAGENDGFTFSRVQYPVPSDPDEWPYIIYVASAFPITSNPILDPAYLTAEEIEALENLLLKLCPTQQWIAMNVIEI